jgi:hypothetical protein
MKKTSLVIMAAGMGSRYGAGIKQLANVGPSGELIIDYSIHDAVAAGFNDVVFIIRKDIEEAFHQAIGRRIADVVNTRYVYQEMDDLPPGFSVPEGRAKPWGTGQAILCCKDVLEGPFAVINADDYYGKQAFSKMYAYLNHMAPDAKPYDISMAGFILKNTLSENGTVSRGLCTLNSQGKLISVTETGGIGYGKDGAVYSFADESHPVPVDPDTYVSMNFWGFPLSFMAPLQEGFTAFLSNLQNPQKDEYLLPHIVDELIKAQKAEVSLLETTDRWFGVTYQADKQSVVDAIAALVAQGEYKANLYE